MVSMVDEGRGLVKTYWKNIRERVARVEPAFAAMVDDLDPGEKFPLFISYSPYAALLGDEYGPLLPTLDGNYFRLSDADAPKEAVTHLGYGKDSSPFGLVLDKNIELFIDLPEANITIPWSILAPGKFFSYTRNMNSQSKRIYAPNGVLTGMSGARSVFMLPSIGSTVNHTRVQREFNIQTPPAKTLYQHWQLFKDIFDSPVVQNGWKSSVLYFSENWVNHFNENKAWMPLKTYLHDLAWETFQFNRDRYCYDIAFSIIQKEKNLKPNPYLVDTARQLFVIAMGEAPGYIPVTDDASMPYLLYQQVFAHIYNLKRHYPTIMHPAHHDFYASALPTYYSLQHPSVHSFSPKARTTPNTLIELRELEHIVKVFTECLAKGNRVCSGTYINEIAKNIQFKFHHNELDKHSIVTHSKNIASLDQRFSEIVPENKMDSVDVATDAVFMRGCISIQKKT